jgi:KDO2-lipid IV(A) lauroyltransferase
MSVFSCDTAMTLIRRIRQVGEVLLIGIGLMTIPFLPRGAVVRLARWAGGVGYRFATGLRRVACANIDLVYGNTISDAEKDAIARQSFKTVALTLLDIFWFFRFTRRRLARWVINDPSFDAYFVPGARVLVTAHFGNWEAIGQACALRGRPTVSVAAPLENGLADAVLDRARSAIGQVIVPQQGAVKELFRVLKENRTVGLVLDQNTHPREGGIFVPFFGRQVPVSRVPAALLLRTGADLIFVFCYADSQGRYRVYARGPFTSAQTGGSEEATTAFIMAAMEAEFRLNPGHWLWMYKRWKLVPEGEDMKRYPYYARPA